MQRTMVSISVLLWHNRYKLTFEDNHGLNPPPPRCDGNGDGDALTVVCCRTHIDGPRAHIVDGVVLIHQVIDGRLVHIQDIVLMTRGIVCSRDLHLKVREGHSAHLARQALSLVCHHAVG
jgi:hypothetical protein